MSGNKLTALALLSLLGATSAASGQELGNSPYSRLGLGNFNENTGGVRQQGMGGTGLAAPNAVQVNDLNPALVYYTNRTTYEVALAGQLKQLRSSRASQRTGDANLGYIAFAVPISRRWALSSGLRPLTSVDYESVSFGTIANEPGAQVRTEYRGSGGISEAYVAQGVRLAKGLTAGVTASYLFGTVERSSLSVVVPQASSTVPYENELIRQVGTTERAKYNDFAFRTGLHYRRELSGKISGNLGAVYSFQSDLNGRRTVQLEQQDLNGNSITDENGNVVLPPLLLQDNARVQATLPSALQVGISFDNNKNWSLNADVTHRQWSKFRTPNPVAGVSYDDTWRVGIGGEISPDPNSVTNYFQRVSYRFGLSTAQLPFRPNGQTLHDRAVSFGFTLPFPSSSALDATNMNLAFTYGQRGNAEGSNIKENYMKVQLGFSLNSRWFLKRRIE